MLICCQVFFLTDSVALVLHRPYSMVETPYTVRIRWFIKSVLQDAVISTQVPARSSEARSSVSRKSELGLRKQDQRIRKGDAFPAMLTVK